MNGSVEYKMELLANSSDPTDRDQALKFYQSRFIKQDEKTGENKATAIIKRFSEILPGKPDWLWEGHIPRGMFVIIGGDPGQGKSAVGLDIAARISAGLPFIHSLLPIGRNE